VSLKHDGKERKVEKPEEAGIGNSALKHSCDMRDKQYEQYYITGVFNISV